MLSSNTQGMLESAGSGLYLFYAVRLWIEAIALGRGAKEVCCYAEFATVDFYAKLILFTLKGLLMHFSILPKTL